MAFFPEQLEQAVQTMNTGLDRLSHGIETINGLPADTYMEFSRNIQMLRDTVQYLSQHIMEFKHEQQTATEMGKRVELANQNTSRI
ncbi:hypothetical protein LSG31_14990 [Fodinisporobacter ferrooxydans]|uniref:Uncharacterized protein n=1 Tax=Fodinisporobacter ferrooxydans TaxID=2901836 RepID=A0ABY4CFM8_9BACL|nr:hypothetical protein LSG31_14990 [Alicyclobacillaceae bacterium MYW30-H2]